MVQDEAEAAVRELTPAEVVTPAHATPVRRGRWWAAAGIAVVLVVAAGCGDDGGSTSSGEAPTTAEAGGSTSSEGAPSADEEPDAAGDDRPRAGGDEPATAEGLEQAVRVFGQALIDGDYAVAYERFSARCRSEVDRDTFIEQTETSMALLEAYGIDFSEAQITEVQTRNVTATDGEVLVVLTVPGDEDPSDPTFEPMVYEDGLWRSDDCEGLGGEPDDGAPGGATADTVARSDRTPRTLAG